jgi:hypothetical protein
MCCIVLYFDMPLTHSTLILPISNITVLNKSRIFIKKCTYINVTLAPSIENVNAITYLVKAHHLIVKHVKDYNDYNTL